MALSPLVQLLVGQAPSIVDFAMELLRKKLTPEMAPPTSVEVIAAFETLFKDSFARDQFLIAALEAEIKAKDSPPAA